MFRTIFNIKESDYKINTKTKLAFFGSCFTENIGKKVIDLHLQNIVNPFGIIYNPASVAENIRIIIKKKLFNDNDLEFNNNKWFSYNHHGRFSAKDKKECLYRINNELNTAIDFLKEADFLFISFGTSWVYKLKTNNKIVSNCHKIKSDNFYRQRLSIQEIVVDYTSLIKDIRLINPKIKIIFTVSPIRHWKDGANGNQLSKSVLLLAIEDIVKQNKDCFYFPSYEIVIDDLRDYRFYESDMLHINETAINYIWSKFKETYFDEKLFVYETKINKINKALNHKSENNRSNKYIEFIETNINKTKDLEKEFNIDLSNLTKSLQKKIF